MIDAKASTAKQQQWGEEILVELIRDENIGFGISIIGGNDNPKFSDYADNMATSLSSSLLSSGIIIIKKILPESPAAKCGVMKIGDRLLQVAGIDVGHLTHDETVAVIKRAKSP
ncbi:hypothetical protein BLA29_010720, partial [Euroglyphus maynei]